VILEEQQLEMQIKGNVMLIAPREDIGLTSRTFTLHYAKSPDVLTLIKNQNKTLLSERGNVTADPRTNALWIQDTPGKLNDIQSFIEKIDVPVRQVLIETRLVTIDEKYEQEIGVRFGLTRPGNHLSGSLEGANEMLTHPPAEVNPLSRLNVDLPSANAHAGSIGLALASLGGGNLLDLELSALESEGAGQIMASPRLITANQQPATILSGQEIPYQQAANYGATSVSFEKAVLSLTVTPQITPENRLLLMLQINQDRPGESLVQGVPEIDTRELKTQVLVNNGQTLVLGGIYEQNQGNQVEKIPFFGNLPLIGSIFRHKLTKSHRRELLIFVTPKILESGLYSNHQDEKNQRGDVS
jgi:type IV pilus assembly protein PilQ